MVSKLQNVILFNKLDQKQPSSEFECLPLVPFLAFQVCGAHLSPASAHHISTSQQGKRNFISHQVAPAALISVDEQEEMKAQKAFYDKIEQEMSKKLTKRLKFWQKVSLVYMPVFALTFASVFWLAGLQHAGILQAFQNISKKLLRNSQEKWTLCYL